MISRAVPSVRQSGLHFESSYGPDIYHQLYSVIIVVVDLDCLQLIDWQINPELSWKITDKLRNNLHRDRTKLKYAFFSTKRRPPKKNNRRCIYSIKTMQRLILILIPILTLTLILKLTLFPPEGVLRKDMLKAGKWVQFINPKIERFLSLCAECLCNSIP